MYGSALETGPVRLACDSDQLDALIATPVIFTYADLVETQEQLAELRNRFPRSRVILIDRGLGDPLGISEAADVERWALRPAHAADWWDRQSRVPYLSQLSVYASLSNYGRVDEVMNGRPFHRWIGAWGQLQIPAHPWATIQFASAEMIAAHVDLSIIRDPYFGQLV